VAARLDAEDAGPGDEDAVVAEINITPLTDIFLVLLVIFMVTSTAAIDAVRAEGRGIRVELPKAAGTGTLSRGDPMLTVTRDGRIQLDGKPVERAEVRGRIEQALRDGGSDRVVIRADRGAMFGLAVELMGEARQAGARSVGVVAAPAEGP
jgi:biopolymer transport protein ExbD